jgi:myo-inositol-1(or 4)-monophosphatase
MNYKDFAIDTAREAGEIMKKNFSIGMKKEYKADNTPVTETDIAVNKLVIEKVKTHFPTYSLLAEELSDLKDSEYVWVCDPLDGTAPFSHGYPTFCFSLALVKDGESILGVIYDPILDRMLFAEKGKGAFLNDQNVQVSKLDSLNQKVYINVETDTDYIRIRETLMKDECYITTLYSCLYGSMLVAYGEFVGEIYEYSNPWDAAAAKIIVEEAGGKVTDIEGNEQRYDQKINGFIASNGILHQKLIDICRISKK